MHGRVGHHVPEDRAIEHARRQLRPGCGRGVRLAADRERCRRELGRAAVHDAWIFVGSWDARVDRIAIAGRAEHDELGLIARCTCRRAVRERLFRIGEERGGKSGGERAQPDETAAEQREEQGVAPCDRTFRHRPTETVDGAMQATTNVERSASVALVPGL